MPSGILTFLPEFTDINKLSGFFPKVFIFKRPIEYFSFLISLLVSKSNSSSVIITVFCDPSAKTGLIFKNNITIINVKDNILFIFTP